MAVQISQIKIECDKCGRQEIILLEKFYLYEALGDWTYISTIEDDINEKGWFLSNDGGWFSICPDCIKDPIELKKFFLESDSPNDWADLLKHNEWIFDESANYIGFKDIRLLAKCCGEFPSLSCVGSESWEVLCDICGKSVGGRKEIINSKEEIIEKWKNT